MLDRMAQIEKSIARLEDERDRIRWSWDRVISIAATIAVIIIEILRSK